MLFRESKQHTRGQEAWLGCDTVSYSRGTEQRHRAPGRAKGEKAMAGKDELDFGT